MTILSWLIGKYLKLPPAVTPDVALERDLKVQMPDGVTLLTDRYYSRSGGPQPTMLVRSPYGRGGMLGLVFGRLFAEGGFQVVIQSCRGTFGSGGVFNAFRNERPDGLATLAWLRQQSWYTGELAGFGASYLGLTQWAIAADVGSELKALVTLVSGSEFRSSFFSGESFSLDTSLTWIYNMRHQENAFFAKLISDVRKEKAIQPAADHLPLQTADEVAAGRPVPYFRDWLAHNQPNDPWWEPVDFSPTVASVEAPVYLLGGWYDIFLPQTLANYQRLREAGREPALVIGPWAHGSDPLLPFAIRESIIWLRAHVLNDRSGLRKSPVYVHVMGANQWREFSEWPPAGYAPQRWNLQPNGGLSTQTPAASEPDHYRYDPADPTPQVGGSSLSKNAGPMDNRALEARKDVLVYTSAPMAHDLEVIGPVRAELFVQSSLAHTDFFVRLCDVEPSGKSVNVCDGLLRLEPGRTTANPDGSLQICVELWPTAHSFRKGHQIRVQVSSGAHPRFARNPGSGEPLATAATLKVADQTVYHDPERSSAVFLPVKM